MKKEIKKKHSSKVTWWTYSQHSFERKRYFKTMNERLDSVTRLGHHIEESTRDKYRYRDMKHEKVRRDTLKADLKLIKTAIDCDFKFSVHHDYELEKLKDLYEQDFDTLKNHLLINPLHPTYRRCPPIRGPFYL